MSTYLLTSNPSKQITCSRMDETTSNLVRHVNGCNPSVATPIAVSIFNTGHFWYLVAAWSAQCAQPYTIIEDEELHEIFIMLYPTLEVHSCQTVSHNISDMYKCSRLAIAHHLQSTEHRIHLTLDGWTSPNMFSFLGVTVQFFEKGAICSFVLDFVKYGCISRLIFDLWLKFHEQDVRAPHWWTSRSGTRSSVEIFWYQ